LNNFYSIANSVPQIIAAADHEDTAILITDVRVLVQQLDILTQEFPEGTRHAVAIKTNPRSRTGA